MSSRTVIVVLAGLVAPAAAEPWRATRGSLEATGSGGYFLTSDAAPGRYSEGELVSRDAVALPFRLEVAWRRLGPEAGRSMHVTVAGGVVLIKSGAVAFYAYDDAAFGAAPWHVVPGYATHDEHVVTVAQDAREVRVAIDGQPIARYALAVSRASAYVGVGMKAAPGLRSAIYVRSLAVAHSQ
jgi:hypothetical protein